MMETITKLYEAYVNFWYDHEILYYGGMLTSCACAVGTLFLMVDWWHKYCETEEFKSLVQK